jgi:uncharacterized protein YjbJ (UPF0337 family)
MKALHRVPIGSLEGQVNVARGSMLTLQRIDPTAKMVLQDEPPISPLSPSDHGREHAFARGGPTRSSSLREGATMNWDRIEGNWKQLKGNVKEKWGKLTDDEFEVIGGKRDQLVGKIQERYGCTREEADTQVRAWEESYNEQPRH